MENNENDVDKPPIDIVDSILPNPNDSIPLIPIDSIEIDDEPIPDEPSDTTILHIEIARRNIGIPTTDSINSWLAFVNLPPNNPWCAASLSAWLHQANVKEPLLKTGLARNYVYQTPKRLQVSAGRVLIGAVTMPPGSLVVFQRDNTIFGHIGIITDFWSGESGVYISGNTSPPSGSGSEFSGGGVWEKDARIITTSAFGIKEFVYVYYFQQN